MNWWELRGRIRIAWSILKDGYKNYQLIIDTHPVKFKGKKYYELDGFLQIKYHDFHEPVKRRAEPLYRRDEL